MFNYPFPNSEHYETDEAYVEALNAYFEAEAAYIEAYVEQQKEIRHNL